MTKSLGADTILIYLVSVFSPILSVFVSFLFPLILDCTRGKEGHIPFTRAVVPFYHFPHPITGIQLARTLNVRSAVE
jgi:hypothetical protein